MHDDFLFEAEMKKLKVPEYLYCISYVDTLPPPPVRLALCGHWIGAADEALTCWSCTRLKNVDAELQRIERATIADDDRNFLRDLCIRLD